MQSSSTGFRVCCVFGILLFLSTSFARAQETCGLLHANFDTIFASGFDPSVAGSGMGPPLTTVLPPNLGATPAITVSWPAAAAELPRGKVQVVGTVAGPPNTGVTVAGVRAYVRSGVFITPEFTLDPAASSLVVTATTLDGQAASISVPVTVSTNAPIAAFSTATPVGFAPLPVKFRLATSGTPVLQSVAVDFDSDGTIDHMSSSAGELPMFSYANPGAYTATATLTFSGQPPVILTHRIMALSLVEQRTIICATYAHLRARLAAQDATGAAFATMPGLKSRLLPLFNALGTRMPDVAANLGTLADGLIGIDAADVVAVRDLGAEVRGYPVHFARDAKGVWRIDSM